MILSPGSLEKLKYFSVTGRFQWNTEVQCTCIPLWVWVITYFSNNLLKQTAHDSSTKLFILVVDFVEFKEELVWALDNFLQFYFLHGHVCFFCLVIFHSWFDVATDTPPLSLRNSSHPFMKSDRNLASVGVSSSLTSSYNACSNPPAHSLTICIVLLPELFLISKHPYQTILPSLFLGLSASPVALYSLYNNCDCSP